MPAKQHLRISLHRTVQSRLRETAQGDAQWSFWVERRRQILSIFKFVFHIMLRSVVLVFFSQEISSEPLKFLFISDSARKNIKPAKIILKKFSNKSGKAKNVEKGRMEFRIVEGRGRWYWNWWLCSDWIWVVCYYYSNCFSIAFRKISNHWSPALYVKMEKMSLENQ